MKRVRIVQAGYENFTGEMGHIEFKDGTSVHDLNDDFVRSLSGVVQVEVVTDVPETTSEQMEGEDTAGGSEGVQA